MTQQSSINTKDTASSSKGHLYFAFVALTVLFFIWGFLTALNDILLPYLKSAFSLSYFQASLVQVCFFLAYLIVSPFAGHLLEKVGSKNGIIIGLLTIAFGCCLFYPAAEVSVYVVFLFALFILGSGIVILQVSANPYIAVLGSEKTAASRLSFAQAINSIGHWIGPYFGASLILADMSENQGAQATQVPYLIIAGAVVLVAFAFWRLRLANMSDHLQSSHSSFSLNQHKHLLYGIIAIFLYVGAEVSIGSYLVNYFLTLDVNDMDKVSAGKMVSWYWGAAMVGRFLGAGLMVIIRPIYMLTFFAIGAILMVLISTSSSGETAMWSIIAVGLFNSIMFPTIFTLAIKGMGEHTGRSSGYLCMAIVGGAIIPSVQAFFADNINIQVSFLVPAVCYIYIAWYALVGSKTETAQITSDEQLTTGS